MLATLTILRLEVIVLADRGSAIPDLDNVVRLFDKIMVLLKRKCKRRCSLKRRLEEYCAFRLGVLWFEGHFQLSFDDEAELVASLKRIVEDFEASESALS